MTANLEPLELIGTVNIHFHYQISHLGMNIVFFFLTNLCGNLEIIKLSLDMKLLKRYGDLKHLPTICL